MANWKEGDRVRIVTRAVTEEDRKKNRYFDHMAGLVGTVQNVYAGDEIAVNIDLDAISKVSRDVHKESQTRMREKIQEEHKKQLTKEEADFVPHYVLLVASNDLEKA
jgi:hypothetical protein